MTDTKTKVIEYGNPEDSPVCNSDKMNCSKCGGPCKYALEDWSFLEPYMPLPHPATDVEKKNVAMAMQDALSQRMSGELRSDQVDYWFGKFSSVIAAFKKQGINVQLTWMEIEK